MSNAIYLIVAGVLALQLSACGPTESERVACESFVKEFENAKRQYFDLIEQNREVVNRCTMPITQNTIVLTVSPDASCLLALGHGGLASDLRGHEHRRDMATMAYRDMKCN